MAYCTNTHVAREFKAIEWSSTTVSSTEVDEFIAEADAYIDAKLGTKYVMPVTNVTDLLIIRNISVWLVADRVADILKLKTGYQNIEQGQEKHESLRDKANAMLKALIEGKMVLSGTDLINSTDGIKSYTYDPGFDFVFDRSEDQW